MVPGVRRVERKLQRSKAGGYRHMEMPTLLAQTEPGPYPDLSTLICSLPFLPSVNTLDAHVLLCS